MLVWAFETQTLNIMKYTVAGNRRASIGLALSLQQNQEISISTEQLGPWIFCKNNVFPLPVVRQKMENSDFDDLNIYFSLLNKLFHDVNMNIMLYLEKNKIIISAKGKFYLSLFISWISGCVLFGPGNINFKI